MSLAPDLHQLAAAAPWLRQLAPAERSSVIAAGSHRACSAGAPLFAQGDRPADLLLLLSGRVRTWSRDPHGSAVALKILAPGDLIGCLAVFSRQPQPASAEAVTDVELLAWPADELRKLLNRYPALAETALEIVGQRAISMMKHLVTVSTAPAPARIAAALLDLSGGRAGRIPVSRQDIADLTATTMHTVSRTISEWHRRGLLVGGRSRIDLLDVAALAREAPAGTRAALA